MHIQGWIISPRLDYISKVGLYLQGWIVSPRLDCISKVGLYLISMDCISKVWLYLQGWIVNPKVGLIYPRFISKGWIVSNGCIFQGWIECIYKDGFYLQEWIVSPRSDCIPRLYLLSMMIISPKLCLPRIDGISKVYLPRYLQGCISQRWIVSPRLYLQGCISQGWIVSPRLYLQGCISEVRMVSEDESLNPWYYTYMRSWSDSFTSPRTR